MIFGLLYFCVVIVCVNRSRSSFILYRIVKRHSRQSNVRRIWTCADNVAKLVKFHIVLLDSLFIAWSETLNTGFLSTAHAGRRRFSCFLISSTLIVRYLVHM